MNEDQKTNDPVNEVASSSDTEKSPAQQVETKTEIENNATTSTEQQQAPEIAKKKKYLLLALIPVLLAVIAFGLWKSYQPAPLELQGRVEAETVQVATKVPSRIEEIYVEEGQRVKKGDVLVRLNSPEIQAKKQQAAAALQSALALQSTAERGSQEENIASLYANWQSLKAQQNLAKVSYERGANLLKEGVISRQRRDELYAASQSAAQMTEAAYQQYARAKRVSTSQQKSSADAQVDIAQAALDEAARRGFGNGAFEDSEEDASAIVEEFYPEGEAPAAATISQLNPTKPSLTEKLDAQAARQTPPTDRDQGGRHAPAQAESQ